MPGLQAHRHCLPRTSNRPAAERGCETLFLAQAGPVVTPAFIGEYVSKHVPSTAWFCSSVYRACASTNPYRAAPTAFCQMVCRDLLRTLLKTTWSAIVRRSLLAIHTWACVLALHWVPWCTFGRCAGAPLSLPLYHLYDGGFREGSIVGPRLPPPPPVLQRSLHPLHRPSNHHTFSSRRGMRG